MFPDLSLSQPLRLVCIICLLLNPVRFKGQKLLETPVTVIVSMAGITSFRYCEPNCHPNNNRQEVKEW